MRVETASQSPTGSLSGNCPYCGKKSTSEGFLKDFSCNSCFGKIKIYTYGEKKFFAQTALRTLDSFKPQVINPDDYFEY